jgi:hypothetical protein
MDLRTHCKLAEGYFRRLLQGPWSAELVETRRALLADQVASPFFQQFDQKTNCFWEGFNGADWSLRNEWVLAQTEPAALDALRRRRELKAFYAQVKLLEEEVPRRLEMEKLGTGRRLGALPFAVAAAEITKPDDSQTVRTFLDAFEPAQAVVAQALAAVRAKDRKAFAALFAPQVTDQVRERSFDELAKRLAQGFGLDACPRYLLSADEVEDNAKALAERGQFVGCLRRAKDRSGVKQLPNLIWLDGRWQLLKI